jgi:hypothetical protein
MADTSDWTELTQWPHVMPATWKVDVVAMVLSPVLGGR